MPTATQLGKTAAVSIVIIAPTRVDNHAPTATRIADMLDIAKTTHYILAN